MPCDPLIIFIVTSSLVLVLLTITLVSCLFIYGLYHLFPSATSHVLESDKRKTRFIPFPTLPKPSKRKSYKLVFHPFFWVERLEAAFNLVDPLFGEKFREKDKRGIWDITVGAYNVDESFPDKYIAFRGMNAWATRNWEKDIKANYKVDGNYEKRRRTKRKKGSCTFRDATAIVIEEIFGEWLPDARRQNVIERTIVVTPDVALDPNGVALLHMSEIQDRFQWSENGKDRDSWTRPDTFDEAYGLLILEKFRTKIRSNAERPDGKVDMDEDWQTNFTSMWSQTDGERESEASDEEPDEDS